MDITILYALLGASAALNIYAAYKVMMMFEKSGYDQELIERLHEQVRRRDFIIREEKELIEELEEAEGVR